MIFFLQSKIVHCHLCKLSINYQSIYHDWTMKTTCQDKNLKYEEAETLSRHGSGQVY